MPYPALLALPTKVVPYTGTGTVDGVEPMTNVYKDGFWYVGCLADEMAFTGDKFGDNAMAYD